MRVIQVSLWARRLVATPKGDMQSNATRKERNNAAAVDLGKVWSFTGAAAPDRGVRLSDQAALDTLA